jgi:hypothetical protein
MALNDFLGKRTVKSSTTRHEQVGHEVTISVVLECGDCRTQLPMTYYAESPERLEGRYGDGHTIKITRRADGIDCKIDGDPGGIDTGSWTADDHGDGSDGE